MLQAGSHSKEDPDSKEAQRGFLGLGLSRHILWLGSHTVFQLRRCSDALNMSSSWGW